IAPVNCLFSRSEDSSQGRVELRRDAFIAALRRSAKTLECCRSEGYFSISEFHRRQISETAVRPLVVVFLLPPFNLFSRARKTAEPADLQTLISRPPVKALYLHILYWFTWSNVPQFNLSFDTPGQM